jgi:hypothetical protein
MPGGQPCLLQDLITPIYQSLYLQVQPNFTSS